MSEPVKRILQLKATLGIFAGTGGDNKFECQPCSVNRKNVQAVGYCENCKCNLCKTCFDSHCVPLPTRNHVLLDDIRMQTHQPLSNVTDIIYSDKCATHEGNVIDFFCSTHERLACTQCLTDKHNTCTKVVRLPLKIKNLQEYNDIMHGLRKLQQRCNGNTKTSEQNIIESAAHYSQAIHDITIFRKEINNYFDRIENEIAREARKLKEEEEAVMQSIIEVNGTIVNIIQTMTSSLNTLLKTKKAEDMFIATKKVKDELKVLEECVEYLENDNHITIYKFVPDNQVNDVLRKTNAFGKLTSINQFIKCTVTHSGDININTCSPFPKKSWITGTTVLSDGQLAIVDHTKQSVKLMDTTRMKIIINFNLSSAPWDIVETTKDQLAITVPNERKIQFVSVSRKPNVKLALNGTIKVHGKCKGIAYSETRLAITLTEPSSVKIIDMDGRILYSVTTDTEGIHLFSEPDHLAFSAKHNTIYVADSGNHKVINLTLDGKVKGIYKDKLWCPTGVVVARDGTVLVCGRLSQPIYQLTPDCRKLREILGDNGGIRSPESLAYCSKQDKLFIGMNYTTTVKVLQLEYEETQQIVEL